MSRTRWRPVLIVVLGYWSLLFAVSALGFMWWMNRVVADPPAQGMLVEMGLLRPFLVLFFGPPLVLLTTRYVDLLRADR
jgi:nitrate reductase NapE component